MSAEFINIPLEEVKLDIIETRKAPVPTRTPSRLKLNVQ